MEIKNTSLISYDRNGYERQDIKDINEIDFNHKDLVKWFNTYGIVDREVFKKVISNNKLNDFLVRLTYDEFSNKVIALDDTLFIAIEVFRVDNKTYSTEKMVFIINDNSIWNIQEKHGDYFDWIRESVTKNSGSIRYKKSDYLFFLILDSIVDNYEKVFHRISDYNEQFFATSKIKPTPEFISIIEDEKQEMFKLKKATSLLRNTVNRLSNTKMNGFNTAYYDEIKEQINNLIIDIDFELQTLNSNINMVFSVQGHHLNKVMQTLTVFSIIFIPITFLTGLYGMNFVNMPELKSENGYFILLAIMFIITSTIILYLKKKEWF